MAEVTLITTNPVRLSHCHIWTPKAVNEGDTPKYSVSLLIPKSDKETLRKIKKAVEAAKEKGKADLSIWPAPDSTDRSGNLRCTTMHLQRAARWCRHPSVFQTSGPVVLAE